MEQVGTPWRRVGKLLVGLFGGLLLLMGLSCFVILASGSVVEGHAGVAAAGVAYLAAAAPAIALPFSVRVAKRLLLAALFLLAFAALWGVFSPRATPVSLPVKIAVLVFAVLLAFRAWLALRTSRSSA